MIVLYILGAILALLLLYFLFVGICALFVSPKREYDMNSPFYRFLLDSGTALLLWGARVKIHTTGFEKVPTDRKLLFVSNHRSNFDPLVTWRVFKEWKLAYVSKPSNFKIPFFGRIVRKCCFLAIDRENPRNAIVTINKAAQLLRNQEVSVGIYPEGTRSKSSQLLPFHNGVFKIAQRADADIVVLAVSGTENIHKNYPWRRSRVYLDVLEVIPAETVKVSRTDAIGQRIREALNQNLQ